MSALVGVDAAVEAAARVADLVRSHPAWRLLANHQAALIAALTLMKRGRSASDAIELLRSKRSPVVLCNETFEAWLLAEGATS